MATCVVPGSSARWMGVESGRLGVAAEGHDNRVEPGLARLLTVDVERALGGIGTVWVTLATPIIVDDGIMPGCSVAGGCFGVEALVHNESAEQVDWPGNSRHSTSLAGTRALGGIGTVLATLTALVVANDGLLSGWSVTGGFFGVAGLEDDDLASHRETLHFISFSVSSASAVHHVDVGGLKLFLYCWAQAVERVFGSVARVTRGWPGMLKPALGEVVEVIGVIIDRITRTRSGRGRLYSRYVVLAASRPDGTGLGAHEKLDGSCACLVPATGPRHSSNPSTRPRQQRFRRGSTCHAFWLRIADNSNYHGTAC